MDDAEPASITSYASRMTGDMAFLAALGTLRIPFCMDPGCSRGTTPSSALASRPSNLNSARCKFRGDEVEAYLVRAEMLLLRAASTFAKNLIIKKQRENSSLKILMDYKIRAENHGRGAGNHL